MGQGCQGPWGKEGYDMPEAAFVTKDAFDIQVRSIREREDANEKVSDIRFEYMREMMDEQFKRLEAVVEKNLARQEAIAADIKGEMKAMNERIEKNLAQYEAAAGNIEGEMKAISARVDTQQTKFGWYLTVFGIIITVVIAAIQFWK